jgi:hypothetical protein
MLKKVLCYLSRIFLPYLYTPEGFRLTERPFVVPENLETLDASQKRAVTICNLFANQKQSITEIAKVLDIKPFMVVSALIQRGLIEERRNHLQPVVIDKRGQTKYHAEFFRLDGTINPLKGLCGEAGVETVSDFDFRSVLRMDQRCKKCWARYVATKI